MSSRAIDIAGQVFGRLTAISVAHRDSRGELIWACRCACGRERVAKSSYLRDGRTWHCGCVPLAGDLSHRFWSKVDKSGECWLWKSSRGPKGYGQFTVKRGSNPVLTHRLAWELTSGPIEGGLFVLHRCDNPPCCNPEHLFLGTNADNVRDMMSKGRHRNQISQQAFCKRGHSLRPENVWVGAHGGRSCRTCKRASTAARRANGYQEIERVRARELYKQRKQA